MKKVEGKKVIKCVVVGDGLVGKTCMLQTYVKKQFPEFYIPTVFEDSYVNITYLNQPVTLNLFDTGGQEDFARLRRLSYHNVDVFLMCFSVVYLDSYINLQTKWIEEIQQACPKSILIMVGLKTDLRSTPLDPSSIFPKHAAQTAKKLKLYGYVECSALTRQGLNEVFDKVVEAVFAQEKDDKKSCMLS